LGIPLLFREEFEVVIMIAVRDRRDAWVGPISPNLETITSGPWLDTALFFNESEMALFSECMPECARKLLDTADIVREAIYQH
jgi:hypothetical protein